MSGVEHFHSPAIFHLTRVMVEQGNIVATVCKTKLNGSAKYSTLSTITQISAVQFAYEAGVAISSTHVVMYVTAPVTTKECPGP
jgi:hypothetical protein